jgi:hypothetical protein
VTHAERAIAESSHAYTTACDDGIGRYLGDLPSARSTRDSLRLVGLEAHAAILDDLLMQFPDGPPANGRQHAALSPFDARWEAVQIDPIPLLARYARAHADDLHLSKIAALRP